MTTPKVPDPRLRWPTSAVLCVSIIATACTLIFATGEVRTALLAILGTISTVLAAVLPSLLAPKVGP